MTDKLKISMKDLTTLVKRLEPPLELFIKYITVTSVTVIFAIYEQMTIDTIMSALPGKLDYIVVGYFTAFILTMVFLLLKNFKSEKLDYILNIVVTMTFMTVLVSCGYITGLAVYALKFDGAISSPIVQKIFIFFIILWIITTIAFRTLNKMLGYIKTRGAEANRATLDKES